MDKLIQIVRTFDNYKIRHIDVINNQDSTSRETRLYQEIQKGKIKTDDEAARFIFGKDAHRGLAKYRNFKHGFRKRVLNTLLFIDSSHPDLDEYQQVTYEINRDWMSIRTLFKNNMNAVALPYAEHLLTIVIKYEYAEIAVPLLSHIKYVVAIQGDKKQYAYYDEQYKYYLDMWLSEKKAEDGSNILKMEYMRNAAYKPHLSSVAQTLFDELKPAMEKYNSAVLHTFGRITEIYIYSAVNDYQNLLGVAERALAFFRAKPYQIKTPISIFLHQKMIALMMMNRHAEALEAIEETINLRAIGSFNWFKAQESKVSLLFKMYRFTEGYAVYKSVTVIPEFEIVLEGMNKEMWLLFKAYFHLMHKLGKASDLILDEADFKIKKIINNMPIFEKDKNGMNLALLILDICFSMFSKHRDDLIDRIEAIEKQLYRHTEKTDPNYRFQQFGLMLLEIPKSGFIRAELQENTKKLFKDLRSVPYHFTQTTFRSEVINLEEMWEWLLEIYETV